MKNYLFSIFKKNPDEIQGFNGIRGIAYYMVIYAHLYRPYRQNGFENSNVYLENFLNNGSLCMDAFFVLSGFLIGGQLVRESLYSGKINYRNFLIKRIFRIFPPYYIFIFVQLFITIQLLKLTDAPEIHMKAYEFLSKMKWDLLYMTDYFPGTILHGWSLSVEEKFYLLLPILLFIFNHFTNKNLLLFFLSFLFLLPCCIRLYQYVYVFSGKLDFNTYIHAFYYPFHSRMDSLFLGVFLASVFTYYPEMIKKYLSSKISSVVSFIAFFTLLLIMFFTNEDTPGIFTSVFRFTIASLAWSAFMLKCLDTNSFISKIFSLGIFIPVAKLSYCAYIIHMILLGYLSYHFIGTGKIDLRMILVWTLPLGTIILSVAYIYYLLTERPFIYFRNLLLQKSITTSKS